jgi:hypothetical protein
MPGKHVFVLSGFKSHLINEIRWGTLSPPKKNSIPISISRGTYFVGKGG